METMPTAVFSNRQKWGNRATTPFFLFRLVLVLLFLFFLFVRLLRFLYRAFEIADRFTETGTEIWELLRPKYQQRDNGDDDHFGNPEVRHKVSFSWLHYHATVAFENPGMTSRP